MSDETKNNEAIMVTDHDDFLFRLIEQGHTAIFQWIAVYVASGIGVIEIIIQVLNMSRHFFLNSAIYGIIFLVLIALMSLSLYSVFNVEHHQNKWANGFLDKNKKALFYGSRSPFTRLLSNDREELSFLEYILVLGHFLALFVFGLLIWLLSIIASRAF